MKCKKVYYSRVSTIQQNEERQLQDLDGFDLVLLDKCSGLIPLFERPQGSKLKIMIEKGELSHLEVHSMDRLGRELLSVLEVWNHMTEKGITIVCRNPNIRNIDEYGKVDIFSQLLMSIISTMSQFEKSLIKERQMEGVKIRKMKGLYGGRKPGSIDTPTRFLQKPKNQKIINYLREDRLSYLEISKVVGCSVTTIVKVKKILNHNIT